MNRFISAGAAAVLGLACNQAFAATASDFKFDFDYDGDIRFKIEGVTDECDSASETCFGGDVSNPNLGGTGSGFGPGNGTFNETTFGIGRLSEITTDDGNSNLLWSRVSAGFEVVYMLYGIADLAITPGTPNVIYNSGCQGGDCDNLIHLDFYVQDTFGGFATNPASNRTGFDTFPNVTDGSLLMALTFDPFGNATYPAATLIQNVQGTSLPTTGDGTFYASCTAGPACVGINNVFLNNNGFGPGDASDFFNQFTLTDVSVPAGWAGSIDDPGRSRNAVVPAPSVVMLLIPGLLGLRRFSRRSGQV